MKNDIFASLDWLPTLVDIAGGPKGDGLKKQIEAGKYPGIVKTTLDGVDQRDYLEGKSDKSARDTFFYYTGLRHRRCGTRTGRSTSDGGRLRKLWACRGRDLSNGRMVDNIKRDPFEKAVGDEMKTASGQAAHLPGQLPPISTTGTLFPWASSCG